MLVLTRKHGEQIRIGDHITITVLRMKGKAVRLGIQAPADQSVLRGELVFDQGADDAEEQGSESPPRRAAQTNQKPAPPATDKRNPKQPMGDKPQAVTEDAKVRSAPLRSLVRSRSGAV